MKLLITFIIAFTLLGCASSENDSYGSLYLRSEFTYWQATDLYKFKQNEEKNALYLRALIKADGNPYHFKIADKKWSQDRNCGYSSITNKKVKLNQWVELECNYNYSKESTMPITRALEFDPIVSGEFVFELAINKDGRASKIRVSRIVTKK